MKKIILVSIGAISLSIASCNKNSNNNPVTNAKTAADERDLQGKNFTSSCSLKPVDAIYTGIMTGLAASIKSSLMVYRFDGANITRTTRMFASSDCSGDTAISFEEDGDFNLHKDQRTNDGGKAIDIDYNALKVTTVTPAGVTAANAISLCGANDWSANSQRDKTAQAQDSSCLGSQMPRHNANVYRVDADTLYLGKASDSSSTQRPASLDLGEKFVAKK
jgi:hypothetical protein